MGKKILVLTGSPRRNGNTFAMVDSFTKEAEAKGHDVKRIDCAFMKVGGCTACSACYKSGKPCCQDDDFNKIADDILDADAIMFAAPVYWYTWPAQIKAVIDRMFSFCVGGKEKIFDKEVGLIACCEEHEIEILDGIRIPYERTAKLMKWTSVGEVLIPGVLEAGKVHETDGCRKAAELADKF